MDEIVPGLWIGDLNCAIATDYLDLAGITHIIRAVKQNIVPPPALPSGRVIPPENIKNVPLDDMDNSPILVHFASTNELIHSVLNEVWYEDDQTGDMPAEGMEQDANGKWGYWETMGEGSVLVHCQAGVSRSVTLVAAYLMWRRNIGPQEALEIIRKRRPAADPNAGFLAQLDLYHQCDYQVDLRHKAVRRFLMSKTNILDGGSVEDMLFSYYPSPYPSPSIPKTLTPFHSINRLASPMRGLQRLSNPADEDTSNAIASASNSSAGGASPTSTPSSSMLLPDSHGAAPNTRRRRTFSSTSLPGKDGRPAIDLSISPALPDSVDQGAFPILPTRPADYPSSSLAQPSSVEVKVTETQGRLPGGVPSLRGNETFHNRGQLPQPLYSGPKLRCKMCRRELASLHDHLIDHEPGKGQLAFEHKKRNAPGGAQASAESRTGIERGNGAANANGLTAQDSKSVQGSAPELTSISGSPVVTASPVGSMAFAGKPIQSAASLSASLPPHLAALRMGRATPPQQQTSTPKSDPNSSMSPTSSLSLDLSGMAALGHTSAQAKPTPTPGAGVSQAPPTAPQSPSQITLPSAACSSYFVEPLQWMSALKEGELAGRLDCPGKKCGAKLGSWDWAGMQCGCGAWITPAFALHRSKVDIIQ